MRGKSSKVIETERWVDEYIEKHGHPPTYEEVGKQFGLGRSHSYQRCTKFRHKMWQREKVNTVIKATFDVPPEKFEAFSEHLSAIYKLLRTPESENLLK